MNLPKGYGFGQQSTSLSRREWAKGVAEGSGIEKKSLNSAEARGEALLPVTS